MKKSLYILLCFMLVVLFSGCDSKLFTTSFKEKVGDLTIEIPKEFEKNVVKDRENTIGLVFPDHYFSFVKKDDNGNVVDSCSINFFYDKISRNYSLENYAKIFEFELREPTKKTINGVEWLITKKTISDKLTEYTYYSHYNDVYYAITYSDMGEGNLCADAQKVIENGFKF